jgi:hypothetical protein
MTMQHDTDRVEQWFRPFKRGDDVEALAQGRWGDFFVTVRHEVKHCFEILYLRGQRGVQMSDNLATLRGVVRCLMFCTALNICHRAQKSKHGATGFHQ